jgi:serine/threonine protein kinase/ABC-type branched-subunit amino acid transport system substrate-binding protein
MVQNIQCGQCRTDNVPGAKFCEHCGNELVNNTVPLITQPDTNTSATTISTSRHITGSLTAGNLLDKRYRIVEMVGKGGFGAVYKARDERFSAQPLVAVKEMSEAQLSPAEKTQALKDFHREANLLVQLKHPNLPNVSNVFEEGGKAYLVMDFIEGKTLDEIQEAQNAPLDERQVMGWALQLCTVLDYLHTQPQPIIFRDMKPTNVMVTSKDEIKLIDFGIARVFKAAVKKDTTLLGSQGYAPLEQYGRGQSDARSDIYALGATLYDLLTNERPVDAPTRQVHPTLFSRPRQLNPAISSAVEAIILKAMAEKPQDRYQTAADMYHAIDATGLAATSSMTRLVPPPSAMPHVPSPPQRRLLVSNHRRVALLIGLLILLLVLPLPFVWPLLNPGVPDPIKAWTTSNGELIGLSDGRYAFDTATDRLDSSLKTQAAKALAAGDKAGAKSLWHQAVQSDTSDAEALIYLEDQRVLDSGSPYITLVVGAILTGDATDITDGRDNLQGAYVAQKEYNDGLKLSGGRLVRLLIANAGSKSDNATAVSEQIVQAAQQDATLIGLMGWSRSAYAQNAIPVLTRAHLPMVSAVASADSLSGLSPYFFRVAPPNKSQAIAGAKYAEQQLHASHVALFVDPNNPYSNSLANDFKQQFVADDHQIVDTETYTVGDRVSLPTLLQKALNANPDLIYFAGYVDDLTVLLVNLGTSQPNLQVLGGDALYAPNGYPLSAKVGFSRLRFTSFAYFDEWDILRMNKPQFFSEYPNDFNPAGADHSHNPYGFTRADYVTMLSYDAMSALFQGCQNVLLANNALTSTALQQGLTQITGPKALQGVSGQISFDKNGDPLNKAVVVLYVDPDGHIQMLQPNGVLGCFAVGQCG